MAGNTPQLQEYLEAMARLSEKNAEITVSALSGQLGLSKASVSEMLSKMAEKGFVKYKRYGKIEFTEKGRKEGSSVLRKHRLVESFLVAIGVRKSRIHREACVLEHAISDDVEKRLKKTLGKRLFRRLSELKNGEKGHIASIDAGSKASQRLADLGLTTGTEIKVIKSAPFKGPVKIRVRGTEVAIGRSIAARIFLK